MSGIGGENFKRSLSRGPRGSQNVHLFHLAHAEISHESESRQREMMEHDDEVEGFKDT